MNQFNYHCVLKISFLCEIDRIVSEENEIHLSNDLGKTGENSWYM